MLLNPYVSNCTLEVSILLSPVIGIYDPRLVVLSALISLGAAYTTLEILDHIAVSTTWRRLVWSTTAALTSALGIWSMQCIVTLSLHKHVILSYDVQVEAASLAAGLGFSLLGALVLHMRAWGVRRIAGGGVLFGLAIISSDALGVRAMQLDGHIMYRTSMFIAATMIALGSAMVAVMIGSRLHDVRPLEHILLRLGGSVLMASGSMACYFYLMSGINVSSLMTYTIADPTHLPLALAVAFATIFIIMGALAAVLLDDHASSEQQRALRLSDLYTRERRVSTTLQKALLPAHLPEIPGVVFSSVYLPHSKEAYVGGDWYDAFMLSDGRIAFSLGDVAGHGLSAALTMNVVRHALRACAYEEAMPSRVLARTNRILLRSDHPAIVTAVFAVFNPQTLALEFASAGHPSPLVMAPHGLILPRVYGDPPIGVLHDTTFTDHVLMVPPGGMITLYTDGCTEYDRDLIKGERRFAEVCAEVLIRGEEKPANAIAERLFAKRALNDDVAIFCVQIERDMTRVLRKLIDSVPGSEIAGIEKSL